MSKPSRKRRNPNRQSSGHAKRQRGLLTPHTPAWLAALDQIIHRQAGLALAVMERAGRTDACTICGDTPAPIYDLTEDPFLPVRLCPACYASQQVTGAQLRRRSGAR